MSATMTAQLVTDALVMAIWRRGKPDALLHHSDRGSQGGLNRSSQHQPELILAWRRELLLITQNRADCPQGLPDKRPGPCRCVRLCRTLLQPDTVPLDHWLSQPYGIREDRRGGLKLVSVKPAAAHSSGSSTTDATASMRPDRRSPPRAPGRASPCSRCKERQRLTLAALTPDRAAA